MATRDNDFLSYLVGKGNQFQPYGAGPKRYGASGRRSPNIGPTRDMSGYRKRDQEAQTKRDAVLARLRAGQKGNYMSPQYLNPYGRRY